MDQCMKYELAFYSLFLISDRYNLDKKESMTKIAKFDEYLSYNEMPAHY